jgi:hypothetical protein
VLRDDVGALADKVGRNARSVLEFEYHPYAFYESYKRYVVSSCRTSGPHQRLHRPLDSFCILHVRDCLPLMRWVDAKLASLVAQMPVDPSADTCNPCFAQAFRI